VPGAPALEQTASRIAMLGDSVTNGYFVGDAETYPAQLQRLLNLHGRERHYVANVARAGGSIDMELANLRDVAIPLAPRLAILTFVTNDIYEICDTSREQLLSAASEHRHRTVARGLGARRRVSQIETFNC
jgi:lysophospholipase L1-like esterase